MFDPFHATDDASAGHALPPPSAPSGPPDLAQRLRGMGLRRRTLRAKQHVFRAGQAQHAIYLIHAGEFRSSFVSADGREKVTGFRMRGDLLGLDSLGMATHVCDAMALDVGEVWELPLALLRGQGPGFQEQMTAALAGELRRDREWMLAVATLSAEQRVIAFLLDQAARLEGQGFSPLQILLRMTRADLGSFLSLQLETVVRALSRLQGLGMIAIDHRAVTLRDRRRLQAMLGTEARRAA